MTNPRECSDSSSEGSTDAPKWQTQAACDAWTHRTGASVVPVPGRSQPGDSYAPPIVITDRQGSHAATDGGNDSTAQLQSVHPTKEWTVAYYLGADKAHPDPSGRSGNDRSHDVGSPDKAEQLKAMAAETKGKPVTAVVDVLRETDAAHDARMLRLKNGDDKALEPSCKPEDYVVDHFRLRDGQVEYLGNSPSKGMSGDIEQLVGSAAHNDPARHLGLVLNGDGGGNRGQASDSSKLQSNDDIKAAIQHGLQGSGHSQLDILNLDECLMSQTGALDKLKDVSKDIVASAETERAAAGRVDGQNLGAGLHDLLERPQMDGRQWGDQIVADANAGKNDISPTSGERPNITSTGTATLANIDTAKVGQLTATVDDLGKQLQSTIADPHNKAAVEEIVRHLPRLGADGPTSSNFIYQKRDLHLFVDALQKSIADGKITDTDGKLMGALNAVSRAEKNAVTSYHGSKVGDYDKQGGISAYLPDSDFRDVSATLGHQTDLADVAQMLQNLDRFAKSSGGTTDDPDKAAAAAGAVMNVMPVLHKLSQTLSKNQLEQLKPLTDILTRLNSDTSAQDRQRDLDAAATTAQALLQSPLQHQLISRMDRPAAVKQQSEARDLEFSSDPPGWVGFIRALDWRL